MSHPIAMLIEEDHKKYIAKRRGAATKVAEGREVLKDDWDLLADRQGGVLRNLMEHGVPAQTALKTLANAHADRLPKRELLPFYKAMHEHMEITTALSPTKAVAQLDKTDVPAHIGIKGKIKMAALRRSAKTMNKEHTTQESLGSIEYMALKLEKKGRFAETQALAPIATGLLKQAADEYRGRTAEQEAHRDANRSTLHNVVLDTAASGSTLKDAVISRAQTHKRAEPYQDSYVELATHLTEQTQPLSARDFIAAMDKNEMGKDLPREGKVTLAAVRQAAAEDKIYPLSLASSADRIFKAAADAGKAKDYAPLVAGLLTQAHQDYTKERHRIKDTQR